MLSTGDHTSRSAEIIEGEGMKGYLSAIKRFLTWRLQYSIGDELWFLLNRYMRKSREVIVDIHGSKMMLDLSDTGICKDLFLYRSREPESTKIFMKELSEGMKVVDIGANIGYYVLVESRIVGNRGTIYAIEPEPRNFQLFKNNVELNDYSDRVESFNIAIGNKTGKELFEISDKCNTHRIAKSSPSDKCIEVPISTLDEFLKDRSADFVRMDAEGYEYFIMPGMKKTLEKNHPLKLFIEVHPKLIKHYGGDVEDMLKLLSDADFRVNYVCIWDPSFRNIIRPFKGEAIPFEKVIEYKKPLGDLLENEVTKKIIAGTQTYRIFLEKDTE